MLRPKGSQKVNQKLDKNEQFKKFVEFVQKNARLFVFQSGQSLLVLSLSVHIFLPRISCFSS